ncbi:MAG: hypothetical protein ACXVUE_22830 [Solirubrobacteraceae bacterium]
MSVINQHPARDPYGDRNDTGRIASNPSLPSADGDEVITNRAADRQDPLGIVRFIARVLEHAHTTAMTRNNPDEARAIFHVALSFAEELETSTPEFDRMRFLDAATGV